MRLLTIDDNPRLRALLRHHLSCDIADLEIVVHNPSQRGRLNRGFLAQGYSAVIVDHAVAGGSGMDWLQDLAQRPGFAPIIFLAPDATGLLAQNALQAGAHAVVGVDKIDHADLIVKINAAHDKQNAAQANWRGASNVRNQQMFGGAYVKGYRHIAKIANGSVSDIYLAESVQAGNLVVLKVSREGRREDGVDQSFPRFIQEYEIVRSIRHPNVVHVLDIGVTDECAYLVMEYFPRGDLRKRLQEGVTRLQAVDYALAIAGALKAIHGAGILHRDLKPGNVLIRDDGSIALIDFGLAKHRSLTLEITDKGLIFGTPHYMSPEQGHGKPIDVRTDLYALGIMLYEMLTGRKPFDADNPMAVIFKHAKEPVPQLPEPLATLQPMFDRLLAKNPADRFADADAVIQVLNRLRASLVGAEKVA